MFSLKFLRKNFSSCEKMPGCSNLKMFELEKKSDKDC